MKILITGSNGLLGQKLIKLLTDSNEEVIACSRGDNRLPASLSNYIFHSLDITDKKEVELTLATYKPDVVINTAAMTNVDQCEIEKEACNLLNITAVSYLIESCSKINAHLIHLSTDFIFDGTKGPLTEEDEPNPISYYGWSKFKAEQLIESSNIAWSIVRTVLVYGVAYDMSRSNIVLWVKKSLEDGQEISVVNDQWRTPTLAEDLAIGCYLTVQKSALGVFNISGDETLTPFQMAIKTAEHFGLDRSLIKETDGSKFTQTAKRPPRTGFNIKKAQRQIGYQPHSFESGLKVLSSQLS